MVLDFVFKFQEKNLDGHSNSIVYFVIFSKEAYTSYCPLNLLQFLELIGDYF